MVDCQCMSLHVRATADYCVLWAVYVLPPRRAGLGIHCARKGTEPACTAGLLIPDFVGQQLPKSGRLFGPLMSLMLLWAGATSRRYFRIPPPTRSRGAQLFVGNMCAVSDKTVRTSLGSYKGCGVPWGIPAQFPLKDIHISFCSPVWRLGVSIKI